MSIRGIVSCLVGLVVCTVCALILASAVTHGSVQVDRFVDANEEMSFVGAISEGTLGQGIDSAISEDGRCACSSVDYYNDACLGRCFRHIGHVKEWGSRYRDGLQPSASLVDDFRSACNRNRNEIKAIRATMSATEYESIYSSDAGVTDSSEHRSDRLDVLRL